MPQMPEDIVLQVSDLKSTSTSKRGSCAAKS